MTAILLLEAPGMDSSDLTPEQRMAAAVRPVLHYLTKLAPNDSLLVLAREAQASMQALYVELHYRLCKSGIGRRRR